MKHIKKIFALVLSLALVLSFAPVALAATFTDVAENSPYAEAVDALAKVGIVQGAGNTQFRPTEPVTTAHLVTLLGRLEHANVDAAAVGADIIADGWSNGYMAWARSIGIITDEGQYAQLTQAQVNAILAAYCQYKGINTVTVAGTTRGDAAAAVYAAYHATSPVVTVTGGQIRGYIGVNGVATYKGIPYAAETSGENRFRDPQPVVPWEGVKDCTEYGDIVMQAESTTYGGASPWTAEFLLLGKTVESGEMSEDSLNLNVWTMAAEGDKLPVIVYIHGGGNNHGSGASEIYTGEDIAQKGVVYVSINYRVGIFGFLAYKDSTGEEVTGNFAFKDQIAALKWVQENITTFGGNPGNVTIVGQSAGSRNVQALISSPAAAGLFHQAFAMSANEYDLDVTSGNRLMTVEQAQEEAAASWVGQYTLAELRAMSAEEIQAMTSSYNPVARVVDGVVVTQDLASAFASGNYNQVNMIWGTVTEDSAGAGLNLPDDDNNRYTAVTHATPEAYKTAVREAYPEAADTILTLYPADPNAEDVFDVAKQVKVDAMLSNYYYAAAQKNAGDPSHKTYVYNFSHVVPDTPERMAANGAFHTGDVGYWMNHFTTTYPRDWSKIDYNLGEIMSSYLVNFAATGDPNGTDSQGNALPEWPDVASTSVISHLELGDTVEFTEMSKDISDLWLSLQ